MDKNSEKAENTYLMKRFSILAYTFFAIILLLLITGILLYRSYAFESGRCESLDISWDYITENGESGTTVFPSTIRLDNGERIEYSSVLPSEGIFDDTYMCFLGGKDVKLYIDGELRYELDHNKISIPGRIVKSIYNIIRLSPKDLGKEIRFVKAEDKANNGYFNEIRIGELNALRASYIKDYSMNFYSAFLLFIISLLLYMITIVINRIYGIKTSEFRALSIGMAAVSCWIITDSYMFQLVFDVMFIDGIISYILTPLLPIPFFVYMDELQNHRYIKQYSYVMIILVIDEIIMMVLHFADIESYDNTLPVNFIVVIAAALILMGYIIKDVFIDHVKDYITVAHGISALVLCTVLEIISIYFRIISLTGVWMMIGLYFVLGAAFISSVKRAVEYERSRRKAIEANIIKSNFLASMSHEIRTPINTIMGMNEMILRESKDTNISEYSNYIKRSGNLLLTIIGDVLDFSKIESGKLTPVNDNYETSVMLKDMIDFINERAAGKGLSVIEDIDTRIPSVLFGDIDRIKQILINLLGNAVKYTKEGSITFKVYSEELIPDKSSEDVTVSSDDKKSCNLHFEIIDTGMGIKDEDIDKLFDSFTRVDEKKNRNIQGTGLGLAIVKNLVGIMNGEITVKSRYGEGSNFHVYIPQPIINDKPIGADWNKKKDGKDTGKKGYRVSFTAPNAIILAVDDNASNLMIIKYLLKETKLKIETADSGKAAIESVMQNKYDVILLDHMMPEPDGIEVLKKIKANKEGPNYLTPVIVLTANATAESRNEYLSVGFDDYITKPVNGAEIERVLLVFLPDGKIEKKD
ncbi:MAG: response regulator [Lachnospiraceae bacterium]|nr:response regulator [Lachnospiraceae bacterium]